MQFPALPTHRLILLSTRIFATRRPEKWRYEIWFFFKNRSIPGGPMAGHLNYQACPFQCIRPGELWQCNWLEETGTICSLVYDIKLERVTTPFGFSKGHWQNPKAAHGEKLAEQGSQMNRFMLSEQADIIETFKGKGNLIPITSDTVTL
ncbi:hypothetical protein BS50DRAFT_604108 [Corynespora cassiicola Philippines]|uniref:Phenolic acid decarboxylase n=1 Tax=Corynespora cassiicola Philippines TaxID=1448308 RepID=A0A2T2N856_CORCC|nr:hypothetical protein BS50DRAFT_604108 [Corynespora cassiicola Philippines]